MAIKSPFNFVPVSDRVFSPDWAPKISQDVPFSDGLSGTIDLKITAETPIFIRNGHTKEDAAVKNEEYDSFSFVRDTAGNKRYFIPATSIKGEVRSVLETISFGKLHVDSSARLARRDLRNPQNYPLIVKQSEIHCGWLKFDGEKYAVKDCGRPLYIEHEDIDTFLGNKVFERTFQAGAGLLKENQKTAQYKYDDLLKGIDEQYLHNLSFAFDHQRTGGSMAVRYSSDGSIKGFTGQPSKWNKTKQFPGKHYEFVFEDRTDATTYEYPDRELKELRFIYDQDKEQKQWKWLQGRIDSEYGAPVFFRLDDKTIKDLGFAYLYKMPYGRSVEECLSEEHRDDTKPDLAECIFGYSHGQDSLKGRVQFGNAFAVGSETELPEVKLILASPKASYYPEYIRQSGGGYKTYDNGELAGRKRYYLRDKIWGKATGADTQDTTIRPLDKGTEFRSLISFHNLRPEELGALLSALTFAGGNTNRHQLGMAKPYGYGKCRYDVKLNVAPSPLGQDTPHKDIEHYIALFEVKMDEWLSMTEIKELLAMSSKSCEASVKLKNGGAEYMELGDFADAKNRQEYLHPASELLNGSSFSRNATVDNYKADIKKALDDKAAAQQAAETAALNSKINDYKKRISMCCTGKDCDDIINELNYLKIDCAGFPQAADVLSCLADCVQKKNAIQSAQQSASQACQSFSEFFPTATSFAQWRGKIEKRKKLSGELSEEELDYAYDKLDEAYQKTRKKDKKWSNGVYKMDCAGLVGQELAEQWFKKFLG